MKLIKWFKEGLSRRLALVLTCVMRHLKAPSSGNYNYRSCDAQHMVGDLGGTNLDTVSPISSFTSSVES